MEKKFPVDAKDYKLFEEIGEGVSATVYRALCIPLNNVVAIKILDLERCNNDLDGIRREVQTMGLIDHPNVLCAHCSFTTGHQLWVVMPFMSGGSCLHIMKSVYPEGLEEPVIATLLREVLKALVYLHSQGHIHRDVKAGNILIDGDGTVKLADFGVTACMFDTGDRQRSRNTFVGTPCWMAPEVMQSVHGYDFKADIWSLGITALELAHGHAPFSKYPPMKVLLMTLQNAPPGLDYERDRRFSKSFKDIVGACLVKDSKKRPSAEKLLKHHFFKSARSSEYLARTILDGLPPLGDRTMALKAKEADILVQNRSLSEDKEHLSQQEYIRGISAWNFDPEELKHQAALVSDADDVSSVEDQGLSEKPRDEHNDAGSSAERMSSESSSDHMQDGVISVHELDNSLAAFPMKPLQALKGCFDVGEDDVDAGSPLLKEAYLSNSEQLPRIPDSETAIGIGAIREDGESAGPDSLLARFANTSHKKLLGGIITPDAVISPKRFTDGDWEHLQPKYQTERNHSGPLQHCPKREMIIPSTGDDTSDGAFVQRKGRFKVTSADISPKIPANNVFNTLWGGGSTSSATSGNPAAPFLTSLQCILQQNTLQREELLKLIKYIEHSSGPMESADSFNDLLQISSTSSRERELQSQVIQLQNSVEHLAEELQRQKLKNVQLEKKLNTLLKRDE